MIQTSTKEAYLIDTSAIICYFQDEDGADTVEELIIKSENDLIELYIAFVSFTEIYYITWQRHGKQTAQNRIDSVNDLALQRIESYPQLALIAGEFKAKYSISFADAWIAAIAKHIDAILVHKDPEFETIETELSTLKLPYKTKKEGAA